ncbi:putative aldo-keto reductase [Xylariaceae sp. FL1272]|nr:putative aldo-keto reductase [Xylariaceae sp. FL1272]
MSIPTRKLGRNGPEVPAIGYGLMGLGMPIYGPVPPDDERFAVLDRAHELGDTFWDTSDKYGDCEELIGKWFKRTGKREDIFLASKYGYMKSSPGFEIDSSAAACKKCCDESLKLLGVESIDLYYVHAVNPKTPIEESMRAMAELKAAGKIKHIGLSNVSSADLRRAVKIAPVAAVQVEYGAFNRDIEGSTGTNLLATCRELGIAIVAYSPLGHGMLTSDFANGQVIGDKDMRGSFFPRFHEDNRNKNIQLASQFAALAAKKGCTPAQLAVAWLLKQGDDIIPIPGTKKIKYLEENWRALEIKLTDGETAEIRSFVEVAELGGGPSPHGMEDGYFSTTVVEA